MTVNEATQIAVDALEDWHGQATGDDEHYGVAAECACDMGKAYRTLARKLRRAESERKGGLSCTATG